MAARQDSCRCAGCSNAGRIHPDRAASGVTRDGAPLVGLTTASSQASMAGEMWLADLKQAGATNVAIPLVETRDHASDLKIAEQIRHARGIFLGGGDQVKLVSALSGTPVEEAIRE